MREEGGKHGKKGKERKETDAREKEIRREGVGLQPAELPR